MKREVVGLIAAVVISTSACAPEIGECDLTTVQSPSYYDENGFPAYPGQALVEVSCGAQVFCHAQGIPAEDRFGAPAGLDLDVGVAVDAGELDRLRHARRVAWNLRSDIYGQVHGGFMPPPAPAGETALSAAPNYRAAGALLPRVDTPEGLEILRNWLACGVPVVEATTGESTGIGDIVPVGVVSTCSGGQAFCDSACIDVTVDPLNCGGCGVACGAGQSCADGSCTCDNGLDACGAECVELATDNAHCGSCATSCGAQFCASGSCVDSCPASTTDCGGSCVDLMTSLANCGGCSNACRAGEMCMGGTCTCAGGFTLCGSACVDLTADSSHCGSCDNACMAGTVCASGACTCAEGTTECGGICIDTSSDPANCGGCGVTCDAGGACVGGMCASCGPVVSFGADVGPVFNNNCTDMGCHGGSRPAASLNLTTGRAWSELVGVPASCGPNPLVTPGNVERSYLINKLTGVGMCSGTQMPKRGVSLPPAQIDTIRSWICRGAAND